jgi:hypothetical protein
VSRTWRAAERRTPARLDTRRPRARAFARSGAALPLAAITLVLAAGCGGASSASSTHSTSSASARTTTKKPVARIPATLRVGGETALPAAVQLPAVAPGATGALSVGGLDDSDSSVASVVQIDASSAHTVGALPLAVHDAAAARVGSATYLFGGGEPSGTSAAIFRVGASGVQSAGQLSVGASDIAAATIAGTAYIVGGYTVSAPLRTIVAFKPGSATRVVGMLPRPLRYASVAAVGGQVLIAGGTSGTTAERAILSFDPQSGAVREIGMLPQATTHAAGASLNGWFYVIGGRGEGLSEQRSTILAIDPHSGAVRTAGHLPEALSDIGATSLAGHLLAVGGRNSAGTVSARALTLLPLGR